MLIPLVRETVTCPDVARQFSDFTGTRRVINICPWLNYPFSLLLTAASRVSDTLCSSCSLPWAHPSGLCQHHGLQGCTANWFSQKTTCKQNSVSKRDLLQHCMNSCAGTKEKNSQEGGNKQPWVWPDRAGITVHRATVSAARTVLHVQGTDSVLTWESDKTSLPLLQSPIKRIVHVSKVRHEYSHI